MSEVALSERLNPTRTHNSRAHRRPRMRLAFGAAVVGLATGVTSVVLNTWNPAGTGPTAFAVTQSPSGAVAIRVVSTAASAEQMTRQLHDRGINVRIVAQTATPPLVGTWIGWGASEDPSAELTSTLSSQMQGYRSTIELPAGFDGKITLDVGVPAQPGEKPNVGGLRNALAPGGVLACQQLAGADPQTAERTLQRLGFHLDYWTEREWRGTPLPQPPAGTKVVKALIHDTDLQDWTNVLPGGERNVILLVAAPDDAAYPRLMREGYAPSQPLNSC